MVTAIGVGTATITHYNTIYGWKQDYDTATITVTADPITGVTLTGDNKVKLFGQVQLNANLQPKESVELPRMSVWLSPTPTPRNDVG